MHPIMESLVEEAVRIREEAWKGGHRDIGPLMLVQGKATNPLPVRVPDHILAKFPSASHAAVGIFMMTAGEEQQRLLDVLGGFEWLAVIADAYVFEGLPEELPESLEEDFKTNPSSEVTEVISVLFVKDDLVGGLEGWTCSTPYTISDGGVIEFGDRRELEANPDFLNDLKEAMR